MNRSLLVLVAFLVFGPLRSQNTELYSKETFISADGSMPYRLLTPDNYDATKTYPLLVFLHGSGERGSDNELQLVHGASFFASDSVRARFPAFVVFPQCPKDESWSFYNYSDPKEDGKFTAPAKTYNHKQQQLLEALINDLSQYYSIDQTRLYIGGLSMGAMGTLELIKRNPKRFAAAFAICGGANPKAARKLKHTPLWLFHGEADQVVPAYFSTELFNALKLRRADVKITMYAKVGHDSWTPTFKEPELLSWIFSKSL